MVSAPMLAVFAAVTVVYILGLIIYRLYFHPLASFPGPKLASVTTLYEFYYDGIKPGKYMFKIKELHDKYGPIIRITPEELHCNDPCFIDSIYAGGSVRRHKYNYSIGQIGLPESALGTLNHDIHRIRRAPLSRFFSKASVTKLEPTIYKQVEKLCKQLLVHVDSQKPIRLDMAFGSFTTDVILTYAFGKCNNILDDPLFENNLHEVFHALDHIIKIFKQLPFIYDLLRSIPDSLAVMLAPQAKDFLQYQEECSNAPFYIATASTNTQQDVKILIRDTKRQIVKEKSTGPQQDMHASIFHEILKSDLSDAEKAAERLWQEGQAVIGAGTETVSWTLSVLFFYLLRDHKVYNLLMKELETAIPDPAAQALWKELEKLPYLSACISEALRVSCGICTRLPRISPDEPIVYHPAAEAGVSKSEYIIPPGTPIGMSAALVHYDTTLFPRPNVFDPNRWLDADGQRDRSLEKYILSFSKGSRQCLGINMAYAELYIAAAHVLRRVGPHMKLYETGPDDVEIHHDYFAPRPKLDSKGVRVVVE
ncbi:putative cytochrome P450 [Camillea tinctor]|nr:putative cytochrome P450 [Camillea tinctor]